MIKNRKTRQGRPLSLVPLLHCKTRGAIAEALFIAIATALGFDISRPFNENCRYDFILDWHGHLFRVQLKSAWKRSKGGYYQIGCRCSDTAAASKRRNPLVLSLSKGPVGAKHRGNPRRPNTNRVPHPSPKKRPARLRKGWDRRPYTAHDIDFLIAYIADANNVVPAATGRKGGAQRRNRETRNLKLETAVLGLWYILPPQIIANRRTILIPANSTRSRFAPYRNAWHLLQP